MHTTARHILTALILPLGLMADEPKPGAVEANNKNGKASAQSSTSASSSATTIHSSTSVNGRSTSITRTTGPDGKERITLTTQLRPNSKPKVIEMTPEEFEKKYGDKKKAREEAARQKAQANGGANPQPAPSQPAQAQPAPGQQPAATE